MGDYAVVDFHEAHFQRESLRSINKPCFKCGHFADGSGYRFCDQCKKRSEWYPADYSGTPDYNIIGFDKLFETETYVQLDIALGMKNLFRKSWVYKHLYYTCSMCDHFGEGCPGSKTLYYPDECPECSFGGINLQEKLAEEEFQHDLDMEEEAERFLEEWAEANADRLIDDMEEEHNW
jgi:hypothetical protein